MGDSKEPKGLPSADSTQQLSIYFNWNGHSWEAHEVLGVVPGTDLNQIDLIIEKILEDTDAKSKEFYRAAYRAIVAMRTGLP